MTLRKACAWLHAELPLDGLGPIRPGQEVSHGLCQTCSPLVELGHHVGRGNAWLRRVLFRIALLEGQGNGHFGGTSVLAWWLKERTAPAAPITKAKHAQIRRIAGSAENYRRLLSMAGNNGPKRLRRGWSDMDVTTYLETLWRERMAENA
jgi:hypothetical protein